jgi:hypothetical protein
MRRRKGGTAIPQAMFWRVRGRNQGEAMCKIRMFAAAVLLLLPATAQAQDALARARAECEAKLQIPRVPGSGDSVREMQIQTCVQDKLREHPPQPASSRQRR